MEKEPEERERHIVRIPVEHPAIPPGRRFFVFEDDRIVQVTIACQADHDAWHRRFLQSRPPLVDRTVIGTNPGQVLVTTSFVGHDDEPAESEPKPYATLVWGGSLRWRSWHYATLGEAKAGHWKAVEYVQKAMTESE